jgi:MFS transporter, SP family, ERD6-like sugar transporter
MLHLVLLTLPWDKITQVPVFISEIAPKDIRGSLGTSNQVRKIGAKGSSFVLFWWMTKIINTHLCMQLFICSGCSAAYIMGALLSWRSLVLVGNNYDYYMYVCSHFQH